jgi:transposase InsO family protein
LNVGEAAIWHSRLYNINFDRIIRLSKLNLIPQIPVVRRSKCHACVQAKQHRKPFKGVEEKSLAPLDLIYSDLCEMNGILTRAVKKYFISFIVDATRYCQLYLIKTKDETLNCFKIYKAEVENQLERKIKWIRSDKGGEYLSNDFGGNCAEHGIIHETTTPYLLQSNGVAERKNQTLTYLVNAMFDSSVLSKSWWGEKILTACFTLNWIPSDNGEITPFE